MADARTVTEVRVDALTLDADIGVHAHEIGARQPLVRNVTWQRHGAFDTDAMRNGIAKLIGTHDFASFAGGGDGVPWSERRNTQRGTSRTVLFGDVQSISPWWGDARGQLIEVRIAADGFLPRMVRTIAGVIVEIGQQRKDVDWIDTLLAERDRRLAGETAPARGLTLWRVGYAEDLPEGMVRGNEQRRADPPFGKTDGVRKSDGRSKNISTEAGRGGTEPRVVRRRR